MMRRPLRLATRPSDRVLGSVDAFWIVRIERRRLDRIAALAERRARKRERWERVVSVFSRRSPSRDGG